MGKTEKGQATSSLAVAALILTIAGGAVGSTVTAFSTFVTRNEFTALQREVRDIRQMIERLYERQFGPFERSSEEREFPGQLNLQRIGPKPGTPQYTEPSFRCEKGWQRYKLAV